VIFIKEIKILIIDVDGTLTDGKIYYSNSGEEIKAFNIKDGYAIKNILPKMGIIPVIITGRTSKIVEKRAKELCIEEIYQKIENKIEIYEMLKIKYNLKPENFAVIGDDYNDLPLFKICKYSACPSDSTGIIKINSKIILKSKGGDGAVQEYILEIFNKSNLKERYDFNEK
jgi:3-deoxy-D-manno-octulosonate 8-phosphate phosphatase (KDO 8-P phosphatase)